MRDKFSDRGFGQGINKNFQDREIDGDYCKFLRIGNALGGMSIIMVGDMIKEPSTEGGVRQGRKRFMVRGV